MKCVLIGAAVVVSLGLFVSAASETLINDTGDRVVGVTVEFSAKVAVTGWDTAVFPNIEPTTPAQSFTFNGGSLPDGGLFKVSWKPNDVEVDTHSWTRPESTATIAAPQAVSDRTRLIGDPLPNDWRVSELLKYEPLLVSCLRLDDDYLVCFVFWWDLACMGEGAALEANVSDAMSILARAFLRLEELLGESRDDVFILVDDAPRSSPGAPMLVEIYGKGRLGFRCYWPPDIYDDLVHHLVHAFGLGWPNAPGFVAFDWGEPYREYITPGLDDADKEAVIHEGIPTYLQFLVAYDVTGRSLFLGKLVETYLVYQRVFGDPHFYENEGAFDYVAFPSYFEGPVFVWMVDQFIRNGSADERTIADLLRQIMNRFSGRDYPMTGRDLVQMVSTLSGSDFGPTLVRFLKGERLTVDIPAEGWQGFKELVAYKLSHPQIACWRAFCSDNLLPLGPLPEVLYFVHFELETWAGMAHYTLQHKTCSMGYDLLYDWCVEVRTRAGAAVGDVSEDDLEQVLGAMTGHDESGFLEKWRELGFTCSLDELRQWLAQPLPGSQSASSGPLAVPAAWGEPADPAFGDGLVGDEWTGIAPAGTDPKDIGLPPYQDIVTVYLLADTRYLHIRIDFAGRPDVRLGARYLVNFTAPGIHGDLESQPNGTVILSVIGEARDEQWIALASICEVFEASIPLEALGNPSTLQILCTVQPREGSLRYDDLEELLWHR